MFEQFSLRQIFTFRRSSHAFIFMTGIHFHFRSSFRIACFLVLIAVFALMLTGKCASCCSIHEDLRSQALIYILVLLVHPVRYLVVELYWLNSFVFALFEIWLTINLWPDFIIVSIVFSIFSTAFWRSYLINEA
jgi:hypothetical protein